MKIKFLGTGAADWKLEKHKDMDGFRRNSSALIDSCLLIDPGPNVLDAIETFGIDQNEIKYIINTHRHSDHYNENTVASLDGAEFVDLCAGEVKQIGKYTVEALAANHATVQAAVHFIISDGEKNLFYGLDGAWLLYDEVAAIKKCGIDLAVLDATIGNVVGDYRVFEHNSLEMILLMKASLEKYVKKFCISHMARTLHTSHAELVEYMKQYGVDVAYDGCEIEV